MKDLLELCALAGTDDEFREWINTLESCISNNFSEYPNGEGRNPACHVRRGGKSGTGYKAPYSCVPMTHDEHHVQTVHGEAAVLNKYLSPGFTPDTAKHWYDIKVIHYRKLWIKERS